MSKFLTYEDRLVIAQLLQENVSFGVIGNKLGKDKWNHKPAGQKWTVTSSDLYRACR